MRLSGWGRFRATECRVVEPRSRDDVIAAITSHASLIARGNGRSYGDAAINRDATIIMTRLNRFIDFDDKNGIIKVEAGVLLADLLDVTVPKGWFPLVTPGTKFVTIGGAMACDVHGKNHHRDGSFRQCILAFTLMDGEGKIHICSRGENADLFTATLGGMGLTGIILDATLRLMPVESAYIVQTTHRCANLDKLFHAMSAKAREPYTVAWIDCTSRGTSLGRGVLFSGRHARRDELSSNEKDKPLNIKHRRKRDLHFTPPFDILRRPLLKAFNSLYFYMNKPSIKIVDYDRYFYPLDAIADWNRIYGPKGFVQFQCVIPKDNGRAVIQNLLDLITQSGTGSPLAVLKYLGPREGPLSFPFEGYTLALDFPARDNVLKLQDRLNAIVTTEGGRLYFAKDATASRALALSTYDIEGFFAARTRLSCVEKFRSSLSTRIGLTS